MTEKVHHPIVFKRNAIQDFEEVPAGKGNRGRLPAGEGLLINGKHLLKKLALTSPDHLFIFHIQKNKIEYVALPEGSKELEKEFFPDRILKEDKEKLWEELTKKPHQEHQGCGETEIRLTGKNGELKYYQLRYTSYNFDMNGIVSDWFCQARDITESKEQLKEIRDHKLKLRMAQEGSGMGIWSYDPLLRKTECDKRCRSIFGITEKELNGDIKNIFLRIHPEDRKNIISAAIGTIKQKGRFNHDFRVILPGSSSVRHIAVIGEVILNELAEIGKITGICLNISLHKHSENKAKTNQTFLEESQRIAKIGCFDWDLLPGKIHFTPQVNLLLGYDEESSISLTSFYKKVHPQDRTSVKRVLKDTIKNGGRFSQEFRYSSSRREAIVLWAQGQAALNEDKSSTRLIGTIQDISAQKENEKELKTQNLIIKSILHNLPVIIQIIDKNGVVRKLLGEAGLGRIGMTENQTVGESVYDQDNETRKHIRQVFEGKTINFTEDILYNGRTFNFLSYYFFDSDRELAVGFSLDVSPQKQTEAAFQHVSQKNRELERINKVLDLFVYAAAHDLKNPINNLEMISALMKEASSATEKEEYRKALSKSVKRLKQTIFGLMEIIEVESSKDVFGTQLQFQGVTNQVKEDLEKSLTDKKGRIITEFKQKDIFYNAAFLTSIIKNLLSNAIKYSAPDKAPEIRICTERKNGYVLLSVSDNGIGIDLPQHQRSLFRPFKRFTSQAEGTGVGLHIIKNMVEKNGGYIEIESIQGKGTCFSCYLVPFEK